MLQVAVTGTEKEKDYKSSVSGRDKTPTGRIFSVDIAA
jgi:hypothetical protein